MRFEGAMTAIITPMRDGAVDYDSLSNVVEDQIGGGIDVLVAVGTTGESASLTEAEQADVIRHVVKVAAGRVPVIGGAGANATHKAIKLSKAAADAGADGLLHVTPYYNKPTQAGLVAHFTQIADSTDRPIVLYNVPGRTACDMLPATVATLAEHDRVVAIKEATGDMRRASELIALVGDDIAVLSGDDFTAFTLFALGGHGCISVVSNAMPSAMAAMWDAAAAGDWHGARQRHFDMMPLTELLFIEANPIPVKRACELRGLCGPELRAPLLPCSPELTERLRTCLSRAGLL